MTLLIAVLAGGALVQFYVFVHKTSRSLLYCKMPEELMANNLDHHDDDDDFVSPVTGRTDGMDRAPWWAKAVIYQGMPSLAFAVLLYYFLNLMSGAVVQLKESDAKIMTTLDSVIQHEGEILQSLALHAQQGAAGQRYIICMSTIDVTSPAIAAKERQKCALESLR